MHRTRRLFTLFLCFLLLLSLIPQARAEEELSNETRIYLYIHENLGYSVAACCGILANIEMESSFDPHCLGDQGTSYGICQWHNERYSALIRFCEERGLDYTELDAQLAFLGYELQSFFPGLVQQLRAQRNNASGAYAAGYAWCTIFENPADSAKKSAERGLLARTRYWPKYGPPTWFLRLYGRLDGEDREDFYGYGLADLYINGQVDSVDLFGYEMDYEKGTSFELKNIRPAEGVEFLGLVEGSLSGVIGEENLTLRLAFHRYEPILYGDVNGDGSVDGRDSILLSQYLAGWPLDGFHTLNADVRPDRELNAVDIVLLLQYLAGWDVKLG